MDEGDIEEIAVAEDIYKAATAFDALVEGEGFLLADEMVNLYRRADNEKMVTKWKAISDYLKTREFSGAGTRVVLQR